LLVCVTFFFASAGASSAYLTVSEIFPMETRALAIAFFYAVGERGVHWRFLFPDAERARARYPATAARLDEAIDIPLSANLTERDRDHVVEAVRKVVGAGAGRC
ncbi:MFS transporter, partial [Actinomadura latina]|nr:MFS transporter [Actinomadura latina]